MAQTLSWSVPPGGVAVAADAAENVFTALGKAQPAGDIRLTKTSPGGVPLFTVRFDNTDCTRQELTKHGPRGAVLWQRSDPVNMARLKMAPDGGIVVGGTPKAGSFGLAFLKYDGDGNPLWANRDAGGPANAFLSHGQMRLDSASNACQAASNLSQMSVTRVNADGCTGWSVLAPLGYGRVLAFGAHSKAVYVVSIQVARVDQGGTPHPPQVPDLVVNLADSPDPVRSGSDLAFTALVRNAGTTSAQAVSLATRTTLIPMSVEDETNCIDPS
jgi:hypothetical protein